jgi:hypothetical protein
VRRISEIFTPRLFEGIYTIAYHWIFLHCESESCDRYLLFLLPVSHYTFFSFLFGLLFLLFPMAVGFPDLSIAIKKIQWVLLFFVCISVAFTPLLLLVFTGAFVRSPPYCCFHLL